MFNQLIRYEPAIRAIQNNGYQKICEIGSGQNGICKFLDINITGIDINFKDYQENDVIKIHSNLTPVYGDILAGTQFADHEFEFVICIDMLEHIAKKDRERAIKEILRIGKNAYIALPIGKFALDCDQWLNKFLRRWGKQPPAWLSEHLDLEFPEDGDIRRIFESDPTVRYETIPNDNVSFHKIMVILEILRFARLSDRLSRRKIFWPFMRYFNGGKCYREIYLITRVDRNGQNK